MEKSGTVMTCKKLNRNGSIRLRRNARALLVAGIASIAVGLSGTAWAQQNSASDAAKAKAAAAAAARKRAKTLAELSAEVRQIRKEQAATAAQRLHDAKQKLAHEQALVRKAVARRDAANARADALQKQLKENNAQIDSLSKLLTQRQGDLGELFGVVRVASSKAAKELRNSLLSTQFQPKPGEEERSKFLLRMAQAKSLPSIKKLERMWFEILRETIGEGKVVRYRTDVLQLDNGQPTGTAVPTDVVRVGPFTVVNNDEYLGYLSTVKSLTELDGSMPGSFRDIAHDLTHTPPGPGYVPAVVDVTRGGLFHRYLQRPSWLERIQLGQMVGYIIIAVGIIGVLLALYQVLYLLKTRRGVRAQLKNPAEPKLDNPLGRLLATYLEDKKAAESADVAALHLHEAIQQEVPKLERFQWFLRLAVAAGPLLGLIGTVTGMIITFYAIVASGGGDPTVMATGIGHAMIATVLGLSIAIPLLFINTGLAAFSGSITQTLDEFGNSLLAEQMKGSAGSAAGALLGGEGDPHRASR
ncbi:MAG TPA: MotA/TolQ/ExbB proton channel family protein [Gammaproteobacteria bacterium]|nr:MotA/TolQ/ExbB proton channel family protein [Gammaproteobacteria bacterium]